jgi:hypothetical protein
MPTVADTLDQIYILDQTYIFVVAGPLEKRL